MIKWSQMRCLVVTNPKILHLCFSSRTKSSAKIILVASVTRSPVVLSGIAAQRAKEQAEMKELLAMPNKNPLSYLFFDSYYLDSTSRKELRANKINYSGSCKPDRFDTLKRRVHPIGSTNKEGEWRGLFNENTGETFVYHFDTQKGVGIKYNLSHGFNRSCHRGKVRTAANSIPAYDDYKQHFDSCDRFNKGLHGQTWPFKRGGYKVNGEFGRQHDFIMGSVLQNTLNAWQELNGRFVGSQEFFLRLADELFKSSFDYYGYETPVPKEGNTEQTL